MELFQSHCGKAVVEYCLCHIEIFQSFQKVKCEGETQRGLCQRKEVQHSWTKIGMPEIITFQASMDK